MYRRHVRARWRLTSHRTRRFIVHNLLHADDPPDRLARGVAVGFFVAFTPALGLHMILVVILAWLLRANKLVGLPVTWICNPFTFVPIYYPSYVLGAMVMGDKPIGLEWWQQLGQPPPGWWDTVRFYWQRLADIAVPLWVGCTLVGLVVGLLAYFITFHTVRFYRVHHRRHPHALPAVAIYTGPKYKSQAA